MPDSDRHRPATAAPTDELLLAALERAGRHQAHDTPAVPVWAILEHLALSRRSPAARSVQAQLDALQASGLLKRTRRHSVPTWALTDAGANLLRDARRGGAPTALPESPQHRAWRDARRCAGQEIERFRASLRERLLAATRALDEPEPPHSDVWLELAEELQRACRRLASASHCLYEWQEPDDARADVDDHLEGGDAALDPAAQALRRARRAGRRNIRLWDELHGC
jgi:hypothetical protein